MGRIALQVCEWDEYWEGFATEDAELCPALDHLGAAREQYIKLDYDLDRVIAYCQAYFA